MKFARLIAVWLLMLALPLQGIAAYAPAPGCDDGLAAAKHQSHHSQSEDHAMSADSGHSHQAPTGHGSHDDGQSGDAASHSCCHHVFTGATPVTTAGAPEAPRAITPRISLLSTLFIPELPQRPPRA